MTTAKRSTAVNAVFDMNGFRELITPILLKTGRRELLKACFLMAPWSDSGFLDILMTNLKDIKEEDNWSSVVTFLVPSLYYLYLEQSNDPYTGKEDPRNNKRSYRKFWKSVNVRDSKVLMEQPFFKQLFPDYEAPDVESQLEPLVHKTRTGDKSSEVKTHTEVETLTKVELIEKIFRNEIPVTLGAKFRTYHITAQLLCDSTIEDLKFALQGVELTPGEKLQLLYLHRRYC